ncbi:MAG: LppC family lipoprotein [Methylomonas sp.]|nr:MAG: LppC family lipoprotein [Methylomonas sp.]
MIAAHSKFIMPLRYAPRWILLMLLFLLAACADDPARTVVDARDHPSLMPPKRSVPAPSLPKTDAIKTWNHKTDPVTQHLLTASSLLQSGDAQAAQQALDLIGQAGLPVEQRSQFALLQAQVALSMGNDQQALHHLDMVRPRLLADTDKIDYYQSLAFAQALHGDTLASVSARIRLGSLLKKSEQQRANILAIVDLLATMPQEKLDAPAVINDELAGWLSLARILKQRDQSGGVAVDAIQQWRSTHPGHPANAEFLQAYLTAPQIAAHADNVTAETVPAKQGPGIAVLLPVSGSYAAAGKAVKDGMQAAQRLAASSQPQPPLHFYDTAQGNIGDIYRQAVADGATLVIGPLVKEQVQALIDGSELPVPVLALNHIDHASKANLYQFGLSPVDEAEQLVRKALRDGVRTAMILVPSTPLGQRTGLYLTTAWQDGGGVVASIQSYDPRQRDTSNALDTLLASTNTSQRHALLLSATPDVARQLAPRINYHQGRIPLDVYAMAAIYGGRQNPVGDSGLDAITFCDIPWFFPGMYSGPLSQAALQAVWQDMPDAVMRLVALGIDAYNLHPQLSRLATAPFFGASGRLALSQDKRISRTLVCAQWRGGVPVVSGFVE